MSDVNAYLSWIKENVKGDGYASCVKASEAMAKAFPELQIRKGFFHCASWGRRSHCWLQRKDGLIVDPTGLQHPTGFLVCRDSVGRRYEDLTNCSQEELAKRVPTGVCMNCGGHVYRHDTFCSDACHDEVAADLNDMLREHD